MKRKIIIGLKQPKVTNRRSFLVQNLFVKLQNLGKRLAFAIAELLDRVLVWRILRKFGF